MAQEVTVRASLQIQNLPYNINYQSNPTTFRADQTAINARGPTPGTFLVPVAPGVQCDLSRLSAPGGWCVIQNRDPTNFVTYGIEAGGIFYPLGELRAGETVVLRLSRSVTYGAVGTAVTQALWFVANGGPCVVNVGAFDT